MLAGFILIIEDEKDLATVLEYNLQREGFQSRCAFAGREALSLALRNPVPDLVVLDLMLPDISGVEVCRRLREAEPTRNVPILMLTAKAEEIDRVVGFELGADDCVIKPFGMRELMLRVKAILRRAHPGDEVSEQHVLGRLRVDIPAQRLWVDDQEIRITALEFNLLKSLLIRRGRVQTRDALLSLHAAILGAGIMILFSVLTSHLMSRRLRDLVENARTLAEGRMGERGGISIVSEDELGSLAGSINRMAVELERLMSSLARERDRFEAVLEDMGEGVLALNEDSRLTHVNSAALSLLGLSDVPTGYMLLEVISSPDLSALVSESDASESGTVEFELPGRDSRCLRATVSSRLVTGGRVVVLHDVTKLRRLETVRRDFIENASHEPRTPVSIIQANTETLLECALEGWPRAPEFLEALRRNSERLSSITADLLDISRIEWGRYMLEPRAIRIEDAVRRTLESMRARAVGKRLILDSDVKSNLFAPTDAKALDRILFNLVDNAVKYTPEGGHIVVRACRMGDEARVEVCDDGYGIEPKRRDRDFERFHRVDAGRSREMGGTRLGLSIVKILTEAMNGQTGVERGHPGVQFSG